MTESNTEIVPGATIILAGDQEAYPAIIEAQGASHLRLRIPAAGDATPEWKEGTAVTCRFEEVGGTRIMPGMILHSDREKVWVHLTSLTAHAERRSGSRTLAGFSVTLNWNGVEANATCIDLSAGGMRVHLPQEGELPNALDVSFTVPGEEKPRTLKTRVVHFESLDQDLSLRELGLKFTSLEPAVGARIASYCDAA